MKILISGSNGFVGSALVSTLRGKGHEVMRLSRKKRGEDRVFWNPKTADFDLACFEGFDAVIHLAGKNIASGLWTKKRKDEIFLSRVRDTWLLSQILLRLKQPPKTFICASATGYYGDRGEETLTEESAPGEGFLSEVCQKWEEACGAVKARGIRTLYSRFGLIVSPTGGMMAKMLPLCRLGLGAVLGSGKQFVSWIALEDVIGAMEHLLSEESLEGPVNFVSPKPLTNEAFIKAVARSVRRSVYLRIPASLLRLFFGEMAKELLLSSVRAFPEKLTRSGYRFLRSALFE